MIPLSVVICTYNRASYLEPALNSLTAQTLPTDRYEIVIIDDGSSDSTKEVVGRFDRKLPVKYFYQENAGLAAAKNLGIDRSKGDILFFFDDDDVASPRLLEEHMRSHGKYPGDNYAVLNYTTWAPGLTVTALMKFIAEIGCYLFSYPRIKNGDIVDYTYFWGGRSSCKRSFLDQNGKFDPIFRFGCEDIELGYRLSKKGLRVVYNARAISYMARAVDLEGFLKRLVQQGRSQYYFSSLYDDPQVAAWCEVMHADQEWEMIMPVYDRASRAALALEQVANNKQSFGLELDSQTEKLFYESLWNIFRASKVKGIIEAKRAEGALTGNVSR
jgi:glycosyltransferase involved in cell wall biosynthesis